MSACSVNSIHWFRVLQAYLDHDRLKRQLDQMTYDHIQHNDPAPPEAMFQRLDAMQEQLQSLQQTNPV